MKGYRWIVGLWFLLGCSETSVVGDYLFGEPGFQLSYVDTLGLSVNTVRFDSLPTSDDGRLMIGSGTFTGLGDVSAEAYFLLSSEKNVSYYGIGDNYVFDSVTLRLYQDGYTENISDIAYGTIRIYELTNEIVARSDGSLYNISEIVRDRFSERLIGIKNARLREESGKFIEMKLLNSFGQDLYDMAVEKNEILYDDDDFHKYIKGFVLSISDTEPNVFAGFASDSLSIRIYYSSTNEVPAVQEHLDFTISTSPYFTKISQTNIPEALTELKTLENELPSTETNNVSWIAGGMGYATKVAFPTIRDMLLDGDEYLIASAELSLVPQTTADLSTLPTYLKVYFVDDSNITVDNELHYAYLEYDDDYGRDVKYTIDVTELVENLLQPLTNYHYALLLTMPDDYLNTSVKTVALGDKNYNSELILYTISK